jgi:cytoskeleton protein RodZ
VSASAAQDSGQPETRPLGSFGSRLKEQREKRGITLEQITKSTKIGTRFLEALEEDHFELLPGGIFNKGFVKAYARSVGLDPEQTATDYLAATGAYHARTEATEQAPLIEPPAELKRPRSAGFPWGTIATVLLILAFTFAVWGFFSRVITREKEPSQAPSPKASSTVPETLSPAPSASEPSSSPPNSARSAAGISPQPLPAVNSNIPQNQSTSTPDTREIVLHIKAREDSWLSITVDGEVTSEQTLSASQEKTVRARNQIVIRTGNVGALNFQLQGKQLPTQGELGEVKTLTFDASGWHVQSKAAPDQQEKPQP